MRSTTYLFEDPDHPDRVSGCLESPEFTVEDRALLLGLEAWEASLCPGSCRQPIEVAWHSDMDGGWWEPEEFVCLACTALADGEQVTYSRLLNTRPDTRSLAPFEFGETTQTPST